MNTTMTNNTVPGQPLAHYDPEVAQRVQGWLASGQLLVWIPILSQDNFPDTPPEILQWADRFQGRLAWPIHEPGGPFADARGHHRVVDARRWR